MEIIKREHCLLKEHQLVVTKCDVDIIVLQELLKVVKFGNLSREVITPSRYDERVFIYYE